MAFHPNPIPRDLPLLRPDGYLPRSSAMDNQQSLWQGCHPGIPTHAANPHSGFASDPNTAAPSDHSRAERGEGHSNSVKKLKFLVSFGGKIIPRPSDGMLRYAGGQTRIMNIKRNVHFPVFFQKMADIYSQNPLIKYQLPGEGLDSLVSVFFPDDLDNMMDESEKLLEKSPDGSSKLRLFLFSSTEQSIPMEFKNSEQRYVDAINGILDKPNNGPDLSGDHNPIPMAIPMPIQLQVHSEDKGIGVDLLRFDSMEGIMSLERSSSMAAGPPASQFGSSSDRPDAMKKDPQAIAEDGRPPRSERNDFAIPAADNRLQVIKNGDLEELRELGSGTFGTVYHGKWRGTDVAIKRINDRCFDGKPSEQERTRKDFWNEATKLAELHHPNVVAFYGVVVDGPGDSVATVTEYMASGSLRSVMRKGGLDRRRRVLLASDVAFGMEYLHGKNIVHFDVKSDNLLVNLRDPQRPVCKVGDLGLSRVKRQTLMSGGVRGTLPWIAPELLNGTSCLVSEKVDVYSFGIVLWELLTGDEPYADMHYGAIIGGIVTNTLRPPVPHDCDPDWKSLMERCWSADAIDRPTFTQLAAQLRALTLR